MKDLFHFISLHIKNYFQSIYILSLLLILCFYLYGLSLNIENLELKSKVQSEIQQLTACKNVLLTKNEDLLKAATEKMLHNEELKSALTELINKSSENVYPKFAIIFAVIVLIGIVYYLHSLDAPASTSGVVGTTTTAYNTLVQSQVETTRVIRNLQSLVENNKSQICRLTEELNKNLDTISNLNLKIEALTNSFGTLYDINALTQTFLALSNNSPGLS